nr:hypothetical protein B0A51_09468 [Rachicladosporium sp. CCFEE 5018]
MPSLPEKFTAALLTSPNQPLTITQIPLPVPAPNELLIKVHACGVCHSDLDIAAGHFGPLSIKRVGHEIVGTVVGLGELAKGGKWKEGDRVGGAWHGGHDGTCRSCGRGDYQMCENELVNGWTREGGYGEYATLRTEAAVRVPEDMDPAEVAPLLCAGVTVFNGMRRMGIVAGDVVAVQGLGGLGHLAIQYARKMGFRTVALSRGSDKKDFATQLGAHEYIDTSATTAAEGLQKLGGAALIIVTAPNPKVISGLIGGLAPRGTLLLHTAVGPVEVDSVTMVIKALSVRGWPSGHALDSEEAIQFARQNGVKCLIEKFPLEKANEAVERMMTTHFPALQPTLPTCKPTNASVGSLPLRSAKYAAVSNENLQRLTTAEYRGGTGLGSPASPTSPVESDFGATPIDASFGERVDLPKERRRYSVQPGVGLSAPLTARRAVEESTGKMDKYARQAGDHTYDSDADADDEFERSVVASPKPAQQYDDGESDHPSESEDEGQSVDGGDTPTTQGWAEREGRSPTGNLRQWTEDQVAEWVASLAPGMKQYRQSFAEEGISGEAVILLNHDDLKELGIASAGHRLTILKAVYEQKLRSGIRIEEGDYVPKSVEDDRDAAATQVDISKIIAHIHARDQRILAAEVELRAMKSDLDRIAEENRKLREETLRIVRLMKDQRTPLPDPSGGTLPSPRDAEPLKSENFPPVKESKGSSLSRKFSTKKLFLGSAPKQPSPTHPPNSHTSQLREVRDDGGAHLEASAAALAASSHLTASMTSQTSPNNLSTSQQLSPTSPAYSNQPSSGGSYQAGRSFPRTVEVNRHHQYQHADESGTGFSTASGWSQASTVVADPPSARREDRRRAQAPTPSPREDEAPLGSARERERDRDKGDRDNPQVEIFKSFRVSIEDPCEVVLPVVRPPKLSLRTTATPAMAVPLSQSQPSSNSPMQQTTHKRQLHPPTRTITFSPSSPTSPSFIPAIISLPTSPKTTISQTLDQVLKRYNIHDDWRQYALYIVHGDQERCLGLKEKPLLLFKQLDKEGRKPMFMLRRHASPMDGWSGAAGSGGGGGVGGGEKGVPGGVL